MDDEIILKCPRCKSKDCTIKSLNKNGNTTSAYKRLVCKSCGLKLKYDGTKEEASKYWNRSKKERLKYAQNMLNRHGNAYIGHFTVDIFNDNKNLKAYLQKQTGLKLELVEVTESSTDCFGRVKTQKDDGIIVKVKR